MNCTHHKAKRRLQATLVPKEVYAPMQHSTKKHEVTLEGKPVLMTVREVASRRLCTESTARRALNRGVTEVTRINRYNTHEQLKRQPKTRKVSAAALEVCQERLGDPYTKLLAAVFRRHTL